jgi:metal-responsive CopG/Arc/MetJ family transcriptional regulator
MVYHTTIFKLAAFMKKVTFTFDDRTVSSLERTAARLSKSKSQVVREAIRAYGETVDRLSDEEREKMIRLFDDLTEKIPDRPRAEVEKELEEVKRNRRSGGRRTPAEKDP